MLTSSALLSQCADITMIALGIGRLVPKRCRAGPTCSGSSASMGEPWEINSPGKRL